ncbi:MAG: type II toxin-antitoxin system HicB family antitoxin [Planctomycetota bacterium]
MNFPVVLHKDRHSDFGVVVPDLPGCFSAGRTVDEALAMAKEAIELHLEGLIDDGKPVPRPGKIERHQDNADYRGGTWAFVTVDASALPVHAKRINITIPERVLDAIDRAAEAHGQTRSGFLVEAANEYIGQTAEKSRGARRPQGRISKARGLKGE